MTWLLALLASLVSGAGGAASRRMAMNETRNRVALGQGHAWGQDPIAIRTDMVIREFDKVGWNRMEYVQTPEVWASPLIDWVYLMLMVGIYRANIETVAPLEDTPLVPHWRDFVRLCLEFRQDIQAPGARATWSSPHIRWAERYSDFKNRLRDLADWLREDPQASLRGLSLDQALAREHEYWRRRGTETERLRREAHLRAHGGDRELPDLQAQPQARLPSGARVPRPDLAVFTFEDGWTVHRLTSRKSMEQEGHAMENCVGAKFQWEEVDRGEKAIYSIRDLEGKPQVDVALTFTPELGGEIVVVDGVEVPGTSAEFDLWYDDARGPNNEEPDVEGYSHLHGFIQEVSRASAHVFGYQKGGLLPRADYDAIKASDQWEDELSREDAERDASEEGNYDERMLMAQKVLHGLQGVKGLVLREAEGDELERTNDDADFGVSISNDEGHLFGIAVLLPRHYHAVGWVLFIYTRDNGFTAPYTDDQEPHNTLLNLLHEEHLIAIEGTRNAEDLKIPVSKGTCVDPLYFRLRQEELDAYLRAKGLRR